MATDTMDRGSKMTWMLDWCEKHGLQLELQGEVGFGRECVGVTHDGNYPDYASWGSDDSWDGGTEVWAPENAYHKHPCVAVLGRGEEAESQLFDWLRWFDANGFRLVTGKRAPDPRLGGLAALLGKDRFARMVKSKEAADGN